MRPRRAVSSKVFGATVAVLVLVAAAGFALYLSRPTMTETTTETMTSSVTQTMTETSPSAGASQAVQFTPAAGMMLHSAWLVVSMTESGQYALSVYAQGLEPSQGTGNDYIVEGAQSSGSMAVVPVGPNATASEFEVGSNGVGSYFTLLNQNPFSSFESIDIVYLPGMQMANATVVATASLSMMSH